MCIQYYVYFSSVSHSNLRMHTREHTHTPFSHTFSSLYLLTSKSARAEEVTYFMVIITFTTDGVAIIVSL